MTDLQLSDNTLIVPEDDEDYLRCVQYIKMRELVEKTSKKEIATYFQVNLITLDRWIAKWTASGLLQRVRSLIFATLVSEEIRSAGDMVSREWFAIVERQVKTAKSGKSDKNSLEAAIWLHEAFVRPRMDAIEGDASAELAYVASLSDIKEIDPLGIVDAEFEEVESD